MMGVSAGLTNGTNSQVHVYSTVEFVPGREWLDDRNPSPFQQRFFPLQSCASRTAVGFERKEDYYLQQRSDLPSRNELQTYSTRFGSGLLDAYDEVGAVVS